MVLALALQLTLAHAAGQAGASGKQGMTCTQCHTGGTAPTVTLTGPAQLMLGASATYTVTLTGGAMARGGFNAAGSTGVTFIAGANSRPLSGELTHSAPQPFVAGSLVFSFTVQVPGTAGTVKLYAAGNSVNNNMNNQGDAAAATTLDVTVVDPSARPDAGTSGADAGSGAPVTGLGDGGNTTVAPLNGDGGSAGGGNTAPLSMGPHVQGRLSGGVVDGGCSAAGGLAPLAVAGLLLLRRRARR